MVDKVVREEIVAIIQRHLPGARVFLFGSRAQGTNREGADYDIAVDAGGKVDFAIMLDITSDLEDSSIYVNVDVVDRYAVSSEFLASIEKGWVEWTTK